VTNPMFRFATVQGQSIHWFLRKNCAMTPVQLGWVYLVICVSSLSIGVMFWFVGAWVVLPLTGLELLAVGFGFLTYARHATDGERISIHEDQLVVEFENAGKLERSEFKRDWVRVEPKSGDRSLIQVSGQGRTVHVGRFIRPELRPILAKEIRMALRGI
jgi:uncharacterized membrane protein